MDWDTPTMAKLKESRIRRYRYMHRRNQEFFRGGGRGTYVRTVESNNNKMVQMKDKMESRWETLAMGDVGDGR